MSDFRLRDGAVLVLARDMDPALALLRAAAPDRVRHAAPRDLSRAGWRYVAGQPDEACAVAEGQVLRAEEIGTVVCRIHSILEADLPHLRSCDRAYAAAEMTAFLMAWLTQFRGARFNAPSPPSLCGPMQWTRLVRRAGLSPSVVKPEKELQVTVVGARVFGAEDERLRRGARRLAAEAGVGLLAVRFDAGPSGAFVEADCCPPLDAAMAAAMVGQ